MTRLREIRENTKMTQIEAAKALNVRKSAYNFWENGKTEFSFQNLIKLADFFNVSTDYLLGRDFSGKTALLPSDENQLLFNYRKCADRYKAIIYSLARNLRDIK